MKLSLFSLSITLFLSVLSCFSPVLIAEGKSALSSELIKRHLSASHRLAFNLEPQLRNVDRLVEQFAELSSKIRMREGSHAESQFSAAAASKSCPQLPLPVPLPSPPPELLVIGLDLMQDLVEKLMNATGSTALHVSLTYDGGLLYQKGFNTNGEKPVDQNTPFRIGSLSKVFTDVMLMSLRDQGLVHLDDHVTKHLPEFSVPSRFQTFDGVDDGQGITLRHLATQLSGLPTASPCDYLSNCNITTEEALKNWADQGYMTLPPNLRPHYSDGTYSLLGRLLEGPANLSWEDFLTSQIIEPLGMNSTGWDFPESVINRMPTPLLGPVVMNPRIAFIDMGWARPTGGMYSTGHDLNKFVQLFLDAFPNPLQPVPSAEKNYSSPVTPISLREMLLPSFVNNDQVSGFGFPMEWTFSDSGVSWLPGKAGMFPGYSASMTMVPSLRLGCSAASNNFIGLVACPLLLDVVLPFLEDSLRAHAPPLPNPGNLTAFAGSFTASVPEFPSLQTTINVSVVANETTSLVLTTMIETVPAESQPIKWLQGNTFTYVTPAPGQSCSASESGSGGEEIVFAVDNEGNVQSFMTPDTDPYFGITWEKNAS